MDGFEYFLHVVCNYHYLGWVLTWKYLKLGFGGGNLSFWFYMEIFEARVLGENLSLWLKYHQF